MTETRDSSPEDQDPPSTPVPGPPELTDPPQAEGETPPPPTDIPSGSSPLLHAAPSESPDAPESYAVVDGELHPLDPNYVAAERLATWIAIGIIVPLVLGAGLAVGYSDRLFSLTLGRLPEPVQAVLTVLWAAGMVGFPLLLHLQIGWSFRWTRFRVHDGGLEIRRGILFRSIIDVPRNRVQHTDVSQGPIQRRYDLGTLSVHTAGTEHATVILSGVSHSKALEIRDFLLDGDDPSGS